MPGSTPSRPIRRRSSATGPRWPACSSASGVRAGSPASLRPRPCCRSASAAGRPTGRAATRSTPAPTSCSAGLERAVDPNGDGDAHDAARIALVPLAEPFAAFADGPLARAVQGALRLDTLVVVAAGNDGPAGPGVRQRRRARRRAGGADGRRRGHARVRPSRCVSSSASGLSVLVDREVPLAGRRRAAGHARPLARRRSAATAGSLQDFFRHGLEPRRRPRGGRPGRRRSRRGRPLGGGGGRGGGAAPRPGGRARARSASTRRPACRCSRISEPHGACARRAPRRPGRDSRAPRTSSAQGEQARAVLVAGGSPSTGASSRSCSRPGSALVTAEPGTARDGERGLRDGQRLERGRGRGRRSGGAAGRGAPGRRRGDAPGAADRRQHADCPARRSPPRAPGMLDVGRAAAAELVVDPPAIAFGRGTQDGWRGRRGRCACATSRRAADRLRLDRPGPERARAAARLSAPRRDRARRGRGA